MSAAMVCLQFRPLVRNTLKGFADLQWGGLVFRDCALHEREGKRWVAPPARPTLDREHALVRDEATGKIRYTPLLDFATPADRARFVREALAAIETFMKSTTPAEASAVNGRDSSGGEPKEPPTW